METYVCSKQYTSHKNLSAEEERAYNNQESELLPSEIDGVEIFNSSREFLPAISAYEHPGKEWIFRSAYGWYENRETGLKVRLLESNTPDYFKENGCGSLTLTLQVKRKNEPSP
jgi:hypothetical protein